MGARSGAPTPETPSTRCSSGTRWCAASPSCPRSAVPTAMEPEGGWKCRRDTTLSPLTSAAGGMIGVEHGGRASCPKLTLATDQNNTATSRNTHPQLPTPSSSMHTQKSHHEAHLPARPCPPCPAGRPTLCQGRTRWAAPAAPGCRSAAPRPGPAGRHRRVAGSACWGCTTGE